jgi:hypothetical protein
MDMATVASIGIDLGKNTFHLVTLDCRAKVSLGNGHFHCQVTPHYQFSSLKSKGRR